MEKEKKAEKIAAAPVILLFSPRQRIESVLTAGLMQFHYRIISANTSYIAAIKATQFVPDIILLDFTPFNIKDFLIVPRLQRAERSRNIPILLIMQPELIAQVENIQKSHKDSIAEQSAIIQILSYPFQFSELIRKIESILKQKSSFTAESGTEQDENSRLEEQMFDAKLTVSTKLTSIQNMIQKHWAFPFTVIRALNIVGDNASCAEQLGKCIASDMAATSSFLRVANTVYFAKRGDCIYDTTEAVVRIGFTEARKLLTCLALIDLSPERYKRYGFFRRDFWMHSLATAVMAEALCQHCGYRDPEMGFVAGLIHDIGKIPLDNNFSSLFVKLLEETANRVIPFHETEKALMNFNHAELGHFLMNQWNFPSSISMAILMHHNPEKIAMTKNPSERLLQKIIFTANIFAKAIRFGHSCDEILAEIPLEFLKELQIPSGPNLHFFEGVLKSIQTFASYLNLPLSDLPSIPPPLLDAEPIGVVYGNSSHFHPAVLALRSAGYTIENIRNPLPNHRIVIYIPDNEKFLETTITDSEPDASGGSQPLKIYLVPKTSAKEPFKKFEKASTVLIQRDRLNYRLLLHVMDEFLGKVPAEKSGTELNNLDNNKD